MKVILISILLFSQLLLSQYSSKDFELVKTTFDREFNPTTILKYLNSENPTEVNAALLSISHSADTAWVKEIIKLNFETNGRSIAFALGQLGPCNESSLYLSEKLFNENIAQHQDACLVALGKIGNIKQLEKLADLYIDDKFQPSSGFYLGLVNYFFRNIKLEINQQELLLSKYFDVNYSHHEIFVNQLFAIYRMGVPAPLRNKLIEFIKSEDVPELMNAKYFAIGSLRRSGYFPKEQGFLKFLVNHPDINIRTETARAAVNYNYESKEELNIYLNLLKDENPNIARDAAASIKTIKFDSSLADYFSDQITTSLNNIENQIIAGELFESLNSLFPEKIFDNIKKFQFRILKAYIFNSLAASTQDPTESYRLLKNFLPKLDNRDSVNILPALMRFQENLRDNAEYSKIVLEFLSADSSPVVYLVADQLDSLFIEKNKTVLSDIITKQIEQHINDFNFGESLVILVELGKKISPEFYNSLLKKLLNSKILSVAQYAHQNCGLQFSGKKISCNFEKLWENSFAFKMARVSTSKGSFTIQFNPTVSPISVGNFIILAQNGFFNNIYFHRVVANFVIQTGDPTGTGWGGPGYEIVSETSDLPYSRGALGMASSGKDTEGSQWFVMHSYHPHLEGRYSNFGFVTEGLDVVDKIELDDKILAVELLK